MRATGRIRPAHNLERAAYIIARQATNMRVGSYEQACRSLYGDDLVTPAVIARATASPANMTDSAWAASLASEAVGDFVLSLAPQSAAAKLVAAGMRPTLDGVGSIALPRRSGLPATDVAWVGEGAPIQVRNLALSTATIGPAKKMAAMVVLTNESMQTTAAEEIVRTMLREDAAASLDAAMFCDLSGTSARHAGLLNGLTPITATAGGDETAMLLDLENLALAIAEAGGTEPVFIMSPELAARAAIRLNRPLPLTIWSSAGLAAGTIVAIDPRGFASAFGTDPTITANTDSAIHMEDTSPTELSATDTPNTVAAPVRSLWQTDCTVLRMILPVAWTMRAAGAIAYITGVTWGAVA